MAEILEFIIVHIEDEAHNWGSLTWMLEMAIKEQLDSEDEDDRVTIVKATPDHQYPNLTQLSWTRGGQSYSAHYWMVMSDGIEEIEKHLKGQTNPTFILDVMRSGKAHAGLYSSLPKTLASIKPYVGDPEQQVRLFTAYSPTDGVGFPENSPRLVKKGIQTTDLIDFLLHRIGFGGD